MGEILSGSSIGRHIEKALLDAKRRIYVISPYISKDYASIMIRKATHGVDVKIITSESPFRRYTVELLKIYSGTPLERVRGPEASDFLQVFFFSFLPAVLFFSSYFLRSYYLLIASLVIALLLPIFWRESDKALISSFVGGVVSFLSIYLFLKNEYLALFSLGFSCWILSSIFLCYEKLKKSKRAISPSFMEKYQEEAFGPPRKVLEVKFVPEEKLVHSKIYIFDDLAFIGSANLTYASLWKNVETVEIFEGEEVKRIEEEFRKIWEMV